jgi:hypothetical protein
MTDGPYCTVALTPEGKPAFVLRPQDEQRTTSALCSVTRSLAGTSSTICRRSTLMSRAPASDFEQWRHLAGR